MSKIKKILVPVDGSVNGCKAVDEAIFFAQKCNADLDFVYVASNINKDIPSHIVFDRIWKRSHRKSRQPNMWKRGISQRLSSRSLMRKRAT